MPRKSLVDGSAHKDDIESLLIDQRWSTRATAQYLELRWGEIIPQSTLRTWRNRRIKRLRDAGRLPEIWDDGDPAANDAQSRVRRLTRTVDEIPDVVGRRIALARLQEARIQIDMEHEVSMGKLFASQYREVEMLNRIYDSLRADLQDMGLFPAKAGTPSTQVNVGVAAMASAGPGGGETPVVVPGRPLSELMPGAPDRDKVVLARSILRAKQPEPV